MIGGLRGAAAWSLGAVAVVVLVGCEPAGGEPGPADHLLFQVQPSTAVHHGAIVPAVEVAVVDADGAVRTDDTRAITIAIGDNPSAGTLGETTTVSAVAGVARFPGLRIDAPGSGYTLVAHAEGISDARSDAFDVTAGPAHHLAFRRQPSNSVSGAAIAPTVEVVIEDAGGNVVTADARAVTLSLSTNPGPDPLAPISVAAVAGVARFPALALSIAATGYRLSAAASGLSPVASNAFAISPGAAHHLAFVTQPSGAFSQAVISPAVQVAVLDAAGNRVVSDTRTVTLSLATNPGNDTLAPNDTATAMAGVATFSALQLRVAGTGYKLRASAGTLATADSAAFIISPGAPARLAMQTQTANGTAGLPLIAPRVIVQDAAGNLAAVTGLTVNVALNGQQAGILQGPSSYTTTDGLALLTGLRIDRAATGYVLAISGAGLTGVLSQPFDVDPNSPAKLFFTVQPANGDAGQTLSAVIVRLEDDYGNAAESSAEVTLSLSTKPAGAVLSGVTHAALSGGTATFDALRIDTAATGYRLTASWEGFLTSAASSAFAIAAGPPAAMIFSVQPGAAQQPTVALTPAIAVKVRDAYGNDLPSTDSISLSLTGGAAGAVLGGTTTQVAVGGVATFSNLTVDQPGTGYRLVAHGVGPDVNSTAFTAAFPLVTGSGYTRYLTDIDWAAWFALDLSTATLGAYAQVNGVWQWHPGTGATDGTFTVPGVPFGAYVFRYGDDYVSTFVRDFDLSVLRHGWPAEVPPAGSHTRLQAAISGAAPYALDDTFQLFSLQSGLWLDQPQGTDADGVMMGSGDTAFNVTMPWDTYVDRGDTHLGLPRGAFGDSLNVTQLSAFNVPSWPLPCAQVSRAFSTQSVDMLAGTTTTVSGAFAALPPDQSTTFSFKLAAGTPGSFAALASSVHPSAVPVGGTFAISTLPLSNHGVYTPPPDLVRCALDGTEPDGDVTFHYGNLLPSYPRFSVFQYRLRVRYSVPLPAGGTTSFDGIAVQSESAVLAGGNPAPIAPKLGTVQSPTLNGHPFFNDLTVTNQVQLAWTAPAGGATYYVVRFREITVDAANVAHEGATVARLITTSTSVELPNVDALVPGHTYYATLTAVRSPVNIQSQPYLPAFPDSRTEVLSGLISR